MFWWWGRREVGGVLGVKETDNVHPSTPHPPACQHNSTIVFLAYRSVCRCANLFSFLLSRMPVLLNRCESVDKRVRCLRMMDCETLV